jgi:hypothetical protein
MQAAFHFDTSVSLPPARSGASESGGGGSVQSGCFPQRHRRERRMPFGEASEPLKADARIIPHVASKLPGQGSVHDRPFNRLHVRGSYRHPVLRAQQ